MTRMGTNEFVKQLVGKGLYDSCGTIDQEVDLEIMIHKEIVNGDSFLTAQRGKHRKPGVETPLKYQYTVLPFAQAGAIRDDINTADTSRRVPGGGAIGSGEEIPWHLVQGPDNVLPGFGLAA